MVKHRSDRLAGELQKEIADIISHELNDPRIGFVSVVLVDVAHDLSSAKVYISIMDDKPKEGVLAALNAAKGFIRHLLGQRIKMRVVPVIDFKIDDSIAYAIHMTKVIDEQIKADREAAPKGITEE